MLRTQRRRSHRRGLQRAAHPRHPERPDQHLGQGVGDLAAPGEGMTTPTESDERDRVMRIIQARCPELTNADLEAVNTLSAPLAVAPKKGAGAEVKDGQLAARLPAYSYQMLRVGLA